MEIKKVGVIGAGVMGVGVGQNLAQTGHEAVLVDISDSILEQAKGEIRKNLRFQGMFQKGAKTEG
ncbi:MAG TPA: 3-hydroxyacyl-CoA dehydrogenase NAD-binding domain-containing protein, partial [Thermoanaerobaculia bacterium]|nr:3-hydroxyacyl-CoA dehydrogenase NAD-binding domain-containing protein [Thermoanaerobaculia bacterium]